MDRRTFVRSIPMVVAGFAVALYLPDRQVPSAGSVVSGADLETLPPGLYVIGDRGKPRRREQQRYYDFAADRWFADVTLTHYGRVRAPRAGTVFPGAASFRTRSDGMQVITAWAR